MAETKFSVKRWRRFRRLRHRGRMKPAFATAINSRSREEYPTTREVARHHHFKNRDFGASDY